MKKLLLILFCLLISSCSSPAEQNLNNSTQVIIEDNSIKLTQTPESSSTPPATPTPSPFTIGDENGALSFLEGSQINTINVNGEDLTLIDESLGYVWNIGNPPYAWSPNGRYLTFIKYIDRRPVLEVVDSFTSEVIDLLPDSISVASFAWNPDGERILFSTETDPNSESAIWIVNLVDLTPKQIPIDLENGGFEDLKWSVNGEIFSFKYWNYDEDVLYYSSAIADIDGNILFLPDTKFVDFVWESQTDTICIKNTQSFEIYNFSTDESIEIINIEGKYKVIDNFASSMSIENITWSPDGNYIAYRINEGPFGREVRFFNTRIHVYDFVENQDYQITDVQMEYGNIVWSPDGDQLSYTLCDENQCSIQRLDIFIDNKWTPIEDQLEYELCDGIQCSIQQVYIYGHNKFVVASKLDPGVGSLYWTHSPIILHPSVMSTPVSQ